MQYIKARISPFKDIFDWTTVFNKSYFSLGPKSVLYELRNRPKGNKMIDQRINKTHKPQPYTKEKQNSHCEKSANYVFVGLQ